MTKIAIVGAGFSGLSLARELHQSADITIFEKSRGVGGRMATRYAGPYQFDHGAQFFIGKSDEFKDYINHLLAKKIITRWDPYFVELDKTTIISERQWDDQNPHYVAIPKMNELGKNLAEGLNVNLETRVTNIKHQLGGWNLFSEKNTDLGSYDWVISTFPAGQVKDIFPNEFKGLSKINNTKMLGCYALMLGFKAPLKVKWQAALVHNCDISWISVNSSKPGRPEATSVLVLSTNAFAEKHIDDDLEEMKQDLLKQAKDTIGFDEETLDHIDLHRWRYANCDKQDGEASYVDAENKLAACGDWCIHGRLEGAYLSALDLAKKIKTVI